jgi:predicted DNA-binding protein with PD1-like motif
LRAIEVDGGWLLRLEVGEKLPASLAAFCKAKGIAAATASGLGALQDVVLGYFDVATKTYRKTELPGSWELLSLFADVAEWQGEPFAHTHVVISGPDFATRGGHLFEGTVSVTAEIRLWTISRPIRREMDPAFGLHSLDLPR